MFRPSTLMTRAVAQNLSLVERQARAQGPAVDEVPMRLDDDAMLFVHELELALFAQVERFQFRLVQPQSAFVKDRFDFPVVRLPDEQVDVDEWPTRRVRVNREGEGAPFSKIEGTSFALSKSM